MRAAVVIVGFLAAWNASVARAAGPGTARSLGEIAEQYRSADREDAVATVALWTQREVEAGTQGLLEAVEAVKAAAFAAAAERVPRGQSALVALGRALDRLGEGTRAQEAFESVLQAEAQRDPWMDYIKGQPDRIDTLLEELRRLVP